MQISYSPAIRVPRLASAVAPLAGAEAVIAATQLRHLSIPLAPDESVYYTVAAHGLPYVHTFDQKPPVIYLWYKLALLLNGGAASAITIHLLVFCVLAATCLLVYRLARTMLPAGCAGWAALLFAILAANPYIANQAEPEIFALPWVLLSMLALTRGVRSGNGRWFIAAGVAGGLAVMTKTTLVVMVAAPLVALAWPQPRPHWRHHVALFAASGAAVALLTVMPWIATGTFGDFWQANVTFNLHYAAAVPLWARPVLYAPSLALALLGAAVVVVFLALPRLLRIAHATPREVWLWLAGGALSVAIAGPTLNYYWGAVVPALAIAAAPGAVLSARYFTSHWSERRVRRIAYLAVIPAVIATCGVILPLSIRSSDAAYVSIYSRRGANGLLATRLAPQVEALAHPGDRLLVIGDGMQIYALTGLEPAVRVFATPMISFERELLPGTVAQAETTQPRIVVQIAPASAATANWRTQWQLGNAFVPLLSGYHRVSSMRGASSIGTVWVRN